MKYIFIVAVGLLLIAGCCNSFEDDLAVKSLYLQHDMQGNSKCFKKRAVSDFRVATDEESFNSANAVAAYYSKVVKFYPRSYIYGFLGGSHMEAAAGSYTAGDILFIMSQLYDSARQYTYDFIKNGQTVHQETKDFLYAINIQDLIKEYLD